MPICMVQHARLYGSSSSMAKDSHKIMHQHMTPCSGIIHLTKALETKCSLALPPAARLRSTGAMVSTAAVAVNHQAMSMMTMIGTGVSKKGPTCKGKATVHFTPVMDRYRMAKMRDKNLLRLSSSSSSSSSSSIAGSR